MVGFKRAVVTIALAALVSGAVGSVAFGQSSPNGFSLPNVGVLRLHLGSTDYFRFDVPNAVGGFSAGTPRAITASSCKVTVAAGLVTLTSTPAPPSGKVGLYDNGLGVGVSSEGSGSGCGRVDGLSQKLTMTLSGDLATKEIDFAELDIEAKNGVKVKAELYLGTSLVGTELLDTATTVSGDHSSSSNNFRWRVPADTAKALAFNKIVFSVDASTPNGAFALEGGSDGTPPFPGGLGARLATSDSLFHITDVEGDLDCGETATESGEGRPSADLVRLDNLNGSPEQCEPVPYLLRSGVSGRQFVELIKDLGSQEALQPQFTMTIAWEPEPAAYPVTRATEIDYGSGPQNVQWCGGTQPAPTLPPGQLWCLTAQDVDLVGGGLIQVTENFYGAGDPRFLR
jgi:hypothetical protein